MSTETVAVHRKGGAVGYDILHILTLVYMLAEVFSQREKGSASLVEVFSQRKKGSAPLVEVFSQREEGFAPLADLPFKIAAMCARLAGVFSQPEGGFAPLAALSPRVVWGLCKARPPFARGMQSTDKPCTPPNKPAQPDAHLSSAGCACQSAR